MSDRMREAFKMFDTDGSGTLSADEVLAILTQQSGGASLTIEDAQEFIKDFDQDGELRFRG